MIATRIECNARRVVAMLTCFTQEKRLSHYLGLGHINSHATHNATAFEMVSREPTIKAENVQKQKRIKKKTLQTIWKLINSYDSHCSRQCTDMSGKASSNA